MNKKDRKRVEAVLDKLEELRAEIDDLKDHEELKLEGLPESLDQSERTLAMHAAVDAFSDALDAFDALRTSLEPVSAT